MRYANAPAYREDRDAIARDWPLFLQHYLPEVQWMLLPNLPPGDVAAYAAEWNLDGFVLTGGDAPGDDPVRDLAERSLLDHAIDQGKPVLGICRGFQIIQQYLGGSLSSCDADTHVASCHEVRFSSRVAGLVPEGASIQVNSYHRTGIRIQNLAFPLAPLALAGEWVECAVSRQPPLMGMLWHPERTGGDPVLDAKLMMLFFQRRIPFRELPGNDA